MRYARLASAIVAAVTTFSALPAHSAAAWYWGKVTQIVTLGIDGSFQIHVDNSTLIATCQYQRVDFKAADMQPDRTKAALSMALLAFSTGREWGVVVDLPAVGQNCKAASTAAQGAGVR
jgi:hypothetical protein